MKADGQTRSSHPDVAPPKPVRLVEELLTQHPDDRLEDVAAAEETGFIGQTTPGVGSLAGYGSLIELSKPPRERPHETSSEPSTEDARGESSKAPAEQVTPAQGSETQVGSERQSEPNTEGESETQTVSEEQRSRPNTGRESAVGVASTDPENPLREASEQLQEEVETALEEEEQSSQVDEEDPNKREEEAKANARAELAAAAKPAGVDESAKRGILGGVSVPPPAAVSAAANGPSAPEAATGAVAMPALGGAGAALEGGDPAASAEAMEARLEGAAEDESEMTEEVTLESLPESTIEEAIAENETPEPIGAQELEEGGEESEQLSPLERDTAMSSLAEERGGGEYTGGGGGGGSPLKEEAPVQPPDVSGLEPESGLAAIACLPPVALRRALGGVSTAVERTAGKERDGLRAAPPTMERPTGLAAESSDPGPVPAAAKAVERRAEPVQRGPEKPTPSPVPLPVPAPVAKAHVPAPRAAASDGKVSADDAGRVQASLADLPATDPGLRVEPGRAPEVALEGSADPAQADAQRGVLAGSVLQTQQTGLIDVAQDMGETRIRPVVPSETLTAVTPPSAESVAGSAGQQAMGVEGLDEEALSIIAQQERGDEINGAVAEASAGMAQKRSDYSTSVETEKETSAEEMAAVEAETAVEQEGLRSQAQSEVAAARQSWSQEQGELVTDANTEADGVVGQGHKDVQGKVRGANIDSQAELDAGVVEADGYRKDAEAQAAQKKATAKSESKGIFGWLASKVQDFVADLKAAFTEIFDFAIKAIRKAIDLAKKAAVALIEVARKAIVTIIDGIGKALILIGDVLLAAFPVLREKWRNFITEKVESAKAEVNAAADRLKARAQELLDKLGAGLEKAIGWLEKGLNALIDGVANVIDGALKFAESAMQMLGVFATLIKDIAKDPLGWIKNLGASVVDGIRNHLWGALKVAIQEWFNAKVEEVLGLGLTVWNLLKEGGFSLDAIGKMAWEGIKSMIPAVLVQILVEKLVAMIVPAAGAIMAIVEGIRAGWGSIKRIIVAIDTFVAFLKQVKLGGAGPHFARALAAAAVAVIDFVSNWLLVKLAKGASKIAGKIKGIAQRIFKKFKAWRRRRRRSKYRPRRKQRNKSKKAKPRSDTQKKQDRLDTAVKAIRPQVKSLLRKGVSKWVLKARLAIWRLRYRLSRLELGSDGSIRAVVNPQTIVDTTNPAEVGKVLLPILMDVERQVLRSYKNRRKSGFIIPTLDEVNNSRNLRMGKSSVRPTGIVVFNPKNMAQYFRPGDSKYTTMARQSRLPSPTLLTLERARGVGNVVGMDLADAMAVSGVPGSDALVQNDNIMKGEGAAKAADMRHFVDQGYGGSLTSSTDPVKLQRAQEKVDNGEEGRMTGIGEVFLTLRSALLAGDPSLLADPDSPLTELARAFNVWLTANIPSDDGSVSRTELAVARRTLTTRLRAFMRSWRGV